MGFKIAVSKTNINVGTATNANSFNYSSDYNTLKYYIAGNLTLTGSAIFPNENFYYGTVTHNLGYIPFFFFAANDPNNNGTVYYPYGYINPGNGFTIVASASAGTDIIRFLFEITNSSSGTVFGTVNYYYKIFRNNTGL